MIWLLILSLLCGCSHDCPDGYKQDAQVVIRCLVEELSASHSLSDLTKRQKKIKKLYTELAELAIESRKLQDKRPSCGLHDLDENLNELLKKELQRIYAIEGGRALMEETQKEAIEQLDEYESTRKTL